ncbi:peptide ABC transporter substrate-binding protein [Rubritalea sp.]|uniref:peptide ABC transporter substrate-binding protein n=1 Tax=Rubritalea sp. TaxID=2109375 RepID=UPI003EF331D5
MRRLTHLLILFTALTLLTSCQDETPVEKYTTQKVLVVGNSTEPEALDPQIVTGVIESNIIRSLFEGLCVEHPSEEGVHLPGAAESWSSNEDFTEWTFQLQPNGKWSDGAPVTTADFLFAYERILTPDFAAKYASMLYYIVGAEDFNKGISKDFSTVGVEAPDSHTLKFKLRASIPFLPDLTKHYTWYPVPKHLVLKHGDMATPNNPWNNDENLVGNGPFRLKTWKFNDQIFVEKNPYYWDAATVKLEGIRFLPVVNQYTEARMFFNDQLHVTYGLAPEMIEYSQENFPESLRQETYLGTNFLRLNVTREKLKDIRVREALSLSIDSQSIIDNILKGGQQVAYGLTPPMGEYQPPNVIHYDPAKAEELLRQAGITDPSSFKLTLLTTDRESAKIIAEAYQDMWKKNLGIDVEIKQREWKTYLDRMSNLDYDIVTGGWIGDYPDPTTFLEMWKGGDGNNRTGWSNPEYEAVLKAAEKIQDPTERIRKLEEAEKILLSERPIIPMYWYTSNYLLHPSVKGWNPLLLNNHPYKFVELIQIQPN